MASSLEIFHSFRQYIADGTIDLDTDEIKVALVTDAYTKDLTDTIWGDISTHEVTTGAGYTTGGEVLADSDVTYSTVTGKWDATDVTWTALTKTFRFGVIYVNATKNSIVKPLIGIILFDTTPADIVVAGIDFMIQWNTSGICTIT
jgi:hypothetical protein